MKINELKLVYFSPTGTTRKVIMELAKNLDFKSVSFDLSIHKDKKPALNFRNNDFAVFAAPVYSGRVPETYLEYFENLKGNNTPCAIAVTYGCREYEDALLELKTEVEKRGFKVIGAAAFPVEHSLSRTIGSHRPNKDDMKVIDEFGVKLNRLLRQEESFDAVDVHVPGNNPYRKYGSAPMYPKADVDLCLECGECVKLCPTGAISAKDPKKLDKKKCIGCLKCVRSCKQKARYVSTRKQDALDKKLNSVCDSNKQADMFF